MKEYQLIKTCERPEIYVNFTWTKTIEFCIVKVQKTSIDFQKSRLDRQNKSRSFQYVKSRQQAQTLTKIRPKLEQISMIL